MIISNSTPLIYLGKAGLLEKVEEVYGTIIIPKRVYDEVIIKGKELGKKEVVIVESQISRKKIEIRDVKEIKKEIQELHLGEAEAIMLCLETKTKKILIDDKEAYEWCKIFELEPIRTTAFILECSKRKIITKKQGEEALLTISKEGYFLSAEVFTLLMQKINEV